MNMTNRSVDNAAEEVALEAKVFGERFGNSAEELYREYQPYAGNSRFLGCRTDGGDLVAVMRITFGLGGLKTLDDLAGGPWHLDPGGVARRAGIEVPRTVDVATIAVDPAAAGGPAVDRLCAELFRLSVGARIQAWTAMLDDRVLRLFADRGIPFQMLPGAWPAEYLGSPSTSPVYAHVDDVVVHMARQFPARFSAMLAA